MHRLFYECKGSVFFTYVGVKTVFRWYKLFGKCVFWIEFTLTSVEFTPFCDNLGNIMGGFFVFPSLLLHGVFLVIGSETVWRFMTL